MNLPKMSHRYWKVFLLAISIFLTIGRGGAQHQEVPEKPKMWKGKSTKFYDTGAISKAFQYGVMQGHFRYFSMFTDNQAQLSDYYALAGGGGIRYETAPYHGLQFAVSGFYIFNLASSDLGIPDSLSGSKSRYELGLFDLEDPENKKDLDRLEEFYLKYTKSKSSITLGRQLINTPFINLQDGRMRPTGVEGAWLVSEDIKNTKLEGGLLWAISPRSTVRWYYMGESIGLYGAGSDVDGSPSLYPGHTESHYVATLGLHRSFFNEKIKAHVWDFYVDNLFNSAMFQADLTIPLKNKGHEALFGVQAISQVGVGNGGNDTTGYKYVPDNHQSQVYSARLGIKKDANRWYLNYTHITDQGRYLMPREWGRDPFYTFIPRERNEGLGGVNAFTTKYTHHWTKNRVSLTTMAGYFDLPEVSNTHLNKYAFPSYAQFNIDVRHQFTGILSGLEGQLLFAHKMPVNGNPEKPNLIFNKVDVSNYNLVLNYHF